MVRADTPVTVVGGGLAGCEAALQLAHGGRTVRLVEMRPVRGTPAHQTDGLGELVCTNSFKSEDTSNAHGALKVEMAALGSVLLASARVAQVPAGAALAVDRGIFSRAMTEAVEAHPRIEVVREEVTRLPEGPAIIATGPLTSDALSDAIREALGGDGLAFFDAIAPILERDSLDESVVFAQGRWDQDADYLNCPMSKEEYDTFIDALASADVHQSYDWDAVPYFEGCLPIEVMVSRGRETLRFGPMKPIGLEDPRTGERPHAVVQLRREDRAGQMWNLVGFQTRLRIGEQKRVFRMIPGLAEAEFLRFGSIHRNSYLNFPAHLTPHGSLQDRPDLIFAGQLTGVEGYTESAASGILAGLNLHRILDGRPPVLPPPTTMLGALYRYMREADPAHFQPMNSNWGLVDPLQKRIRNKREKRERLGERAGRDFRAWMEAEGLTGRGTDAGTRTEPGSGVAAVDRGSLTARPDGALAADPPAAVAEP
ncbi:MAG: methylenetetrahydrofolate--tRNA-(uracil(54)-C(5))-methyltransferase (FADH(2)-oxidizing) TrmFO [Gemmatimonadales bacterium]|nr:MAG: methylenetetrahydrofolate--tRNA-(uracil(54)-C(5))-methyltransferase (FADH(2)-oxidizing) TrmFO [Gemmatimonadales bacterium]